ncbi:unnamed protein product [Lampetra planeri]
MVKAAPHATVATFARGGPGARVATGSGFHLDHLDSTLFFFLFLFVTSASRDVYSARVQTSSWALRAGPRLARSARRERGQSLGGGGRAGGGALTVLATASRAAASRATAFSSERCTERPLCGGPGEEDRVEATRLGTGGGGDRGHDNFVRGARREMRPPAGSSCYSSHSSPCSSSSSRLLRCRLLLVGDGSSSRGTMRGACARGSTRWR